MGNAASFGQTLNLPPEIDGHLARGRSRCEANENYFEAPANYFLPDGFTAVQGTFGITGPLPSTARRFAVCISELMATTSKTPSWFALPTRSPRFGAITLSWDIFRSRVRLVRRSLFPGNRIVNIVFPHVACVSRPIRSG